MNESWNWPHKISENDTNEEMPEPLQDDSLKMKKMKAASFFCL